MIQEQQLPVVAFKRGQTLDNSVWYMNSLLTFYAESKDTGGSFQVGEWLGKPGNEPPPHVHEREHEFCYVLEGEIDAYVGSDVFRVARGECLLIPQNMPHTFLIRTPRYRMLFFTQPCGLDKYMRAMAAEPALELDFPKKGIPYSASDIQHAIDEGLKYGLRFLSPEEIREQLPAYPGMASPEEPNS
jgi:quercetin dioxygenase-like cupin family protein